MILSKRRIASLRASLLAAAFLLGVCGLVALVRGAFYPGRPSPAPGGSPVVSGGTRHNPDPDAVDPGAVPVASAQPPGPPTTIGSDDPNSDLRTKPSLSPEVLEFYPDLAVRMFSDEWEVRNEVVNDLWKARPRGLPELIYLVGDPHLHVGNHAANVVAQWYFDKGVEVPVRDVMQVLRTAPRRGRENAAYLLGLMRAAEAAPLLARVATTDAPAVAQQALIALGKIGGDLARETAEEVLASHSSRFARAGAAECLESTANMLSGPLLVEGLDHPEDYIRASCIRALQRVGYKPAIPRLLQMLRDDTPYFRSLAAFAFTNPELATPAALPELMELVKAQKRWEHAARALAVLKDERAVPALAAAMEAGDPRRTRQMIECLAAIGGPKAARVLADTARAGMCQREALDALRRLATPEVIPDMLAILHALPPEDSKQTAQVRQKAAQVIGRALGIPERSRRVGEVPSEHPETAAILSALRRWTQHPAEAPPQLGRLVEALDKRKELSLGPVWVKGKLAVVQFEVYWRSEAERYVDSGGKILLQHNGQWTVLALFDTYVV